MDSIKPDLLVGLEGGSSTSSLSWPRVGDDVRGYGTQNWRSNVPLMHMIRIRIAQLTLDLGMLYTRTWHARSRIPWFARECALDITMHRT